MKTYMAFLAVVLTARGLAAAQTAPRPAPAATGTAPAETIAQMEARLKTMRANAAALEAKLAAAKSATQPAELGLIAYLEKLPRDLWPALNDTQIRKAAQQAWYQDNLADTSILTPKYPLADATSMAGTPSVTIKSPALSVLGLRSVISVHGEFDPSDSAALARLKMGNPVGMRGTFQRLSITATQISVDLKGCTLAP